MCRQNRRCLVVSTEKLRKTLVKIAALLAAAAAAAAAKILVRVGDESKAGMKHFSITQNY